MESTPSAYVAEKKHTIFVSGLPDEVDEDRVLAVFVSFGQSRRQLETTSNLRGKPVLDPHED